MIKKSQGNMYDWVTHMHSHLGGECPHKCSYCYVQRNRFGVSPRYKGEPRLIEEEFNVSYSLNRIIFIEHMNDMFADEVDDVWINRILAHTKWHPNNQYVFQTKNPKRAFNFINTFPRSYLMGTTIETNRPTPYISKAPSPLHRYGGIKKFADSGVETFVTIEPIMDFDLECLVGWITSIQPSFINIGADSKRCSLPEPSPEKLNQFIKALQDNKITIRKKVNLGRLLDNPH